MEDFVLLNRLQGLVEEGRARRRLLLAEELYKQSWEQDRLAPLRQDNPRQGTARMREGRGRTSLDNVG